MPCSANMRANLGATLDGDWGGALFGETRAPTRIARFVAARFRCGLAFRVGDFATFVLPVAFPIKRTPRFIAAATDVAAAAARAAALSRHVIFGASDIFYNSKRF